LDSSPDLSLFLLDLDLGSKDSDLDLKAMDLDLGGSASKSFFQVLCTYKIDSTVTDYSQKLFANYMHTREHHSNTATDVSVAEFLARYLRAMVSDCDSEPVDFWVRNNATYDKLIPAVRRTFAIPVSSAPVERVFNHGGIVLCLNRARMSDKLLSELVFLKCNSV